MQHQRRPLTHERNFVFKCQKHPRGPEKNCLIIKEGILYSDQSFFTVFTL